MALTQSLESKVESWVTTLDKLESLSWTKAIVLAFLVWGVAFLGIRDAITGAKTATIAGAEGLRDDKPPGTV